MGIKFSNNGHSTLAASITSSGTSITVASGHGSRFPSLAAGDYFYATLIDASNNLEIVKCTARSSDVLTVTRGAESTTARAYAIGDRIELRVTAAGLDDVAALATLDADPSPSLSANLDLNSNDITGTGNIDITGNIDASSQFRLSGTTLVDSNGIYVPKLASDPASPSEGQMYYNTTDDVIKHWNGTEWLQMSNKFSASGGTEVTSGGYKYHTFTSSGSFTADAAGTVEALIIAGGGGGGSWVGGGAGAGGLVYHSSLNVSPGTYTVTVGAGGTGSLNPGGYSGMPNGSKGGNSSITISGATTAIGGGMGASHSYNNTSAWMDGGSGGGNSGSSYAVTGQGTSGQGNDGGVGYGTNPWPTGGGGGATAAGQNYVNTNTAGNGGAGSNAYSAWATATSTGVSGYYAGGGGGGKHDSGGSAGTGGAGGGGTGRVSTTSKASNGTANTGGGGGGSGNAGGSRSEGGNGGSGIVIIRYSA